MCKQQLYVFEAGSTKTDVFFFDGFLTKNISLAGYNPNRLDTSFEKELANLSIPRDALVFFYGSGVSGINVKKKIQSLFNNHPNLKIFSDILGAARATMTNSKGIVSIMGTGGVVAYYDGTKIVSKHGGYGYLIDDYGGGLELGKTIISNWLNNTYNSVTSKSISAYLNYNPDEFISQFYKTKNLHILAGVCKIIPLLAKNDLKLEASIHNYFKTFTLRHVSPLAKINNINSINLVGSIAFYFKPWINEAFQENNLIINSIVLKPCESIFNYHINKDNSL